MSPGVASGLAIVAALGTFVFRQPLLRVGALAGIITTALLAAVGLALPVALVVGVLAGVGSADRIRRAARRREVGDRIAVERALPDALDLLAGLVESGAPLTAAIAAVAQRVEGPLRRELEACAGALSSTGSRRAAFGLLRQSGSADLARVGQALALADELGTGVAEQLRGQALVQRDLRRSRAREQAGTAAPKIALVIGLLLVPAALSLVLGAELLSALDAASS